MIDARHCSPQSQGLLKRADLLVELGVQALDLLLERLPLLHKLGQQKAMVISYPSFQRLHQLWNLVL